MDEHDFSKWRRFAEHALGWPFEHIEADIHFEKEHLNTPIDFDDLISSGKLERITASKYKRLIPPDELPRYVWAQVIEADVGHALHDG